MTLFLLILSTFAFVELFVRLPIIDLARQSAALAKRSSTVIRAEKISDHWKERVLPMYSQRIFIHTVRLIGCLLIVFAPIAVALGIAALIDEPLWEYLASIKGIAISMAAAFGYIFVRRRLVRA